MNTLEMQVDVDIPKIEREVYYTRLQKNIRFHGSRSRRRGTRRKGRSLYAREKAIERNNAERKEAEKQGRKEEKGKGGKKEETVSLLSIPKKDILVRGEGRRRNGNNH